ncbi:hypothetical protein ACFLQV_02210 [Calditrichota bacterium]
MNSKQRMSNQVITLVLLLSVIMFMPTGYIFAQEEEPYTEEDTMLEEGMEGEMMMEDEMMMEEAASDEMMDLDIGSDAALESALEADSLWNAWMGLNYDGRRAYYFRRKFTINERPSGGHVYMTADDNLSLYVNGNYLFDDDRDTIDWMEVKEYDVSDYIVQGENIIAVEAVDVDDTRHGVRIGLVYETIPDIEAQLELMVERELEQQRQAREADKPGVPTKEQMFEMRAYEKNKLR